MKYNVKYNYKGASYGAEVDAKNKEEATTKAIIRASHLFDRVNEVTIASITEIVNIIPGSQKK